MDRILILRHLRRASISSLNTNFCWVVCKLLLSSTFTLVIVSLRLEKKEYRLFSTSATHVHRYTVYSWGTRS